MKKVHHNRYSYTDRVIDFTFVRNVRLPTTILPPKAIGLITTSNMARITWESPILLPYQGFKLSYIHFSHSVTHSFFLIFEGFKMKFKF